MTKIPAGRCLRLQPPLARPQPSRKPRRYCAAAGAKRGSFFPEGVASGDPDSTSVILWTRRPYAAGHKTPRLIVEVLRGGPVCGGDREVHDTLVKAIATTVAGAPRGSASMLLRRRTDGRCAVLHLLRLGQASHASAPRILARVCHNAALLAPDTQAVRRAFGLSQNEAEIALRIAAGDSPRMIANKRVVSEETVRWHIKNIYSKICTNRLVDLVQQLCAALSPFFAGAGASVPLPPRDHHLMRSNAAPVLAA